MKRYSELTAKQRRVHKRWLRRVERLAEEGRHYYTRLFCDRRIAYRLRSAGLIADIEITKWHFGIVGWTKEICIVPKGDTP